MTGMPGANWHTGLRRYLLVTVVGHFAWEVFQLPLYTLWQTGTPREIVVAVLHCTAGDIVIAMTSLALALAAIGSADWPSRRCGSVWVGSATIGVVYAVYSEYMNTAVRYAWAYSDLMPIVPGLGTGVSPLLQWFVLPTAALWYACRTGTAIKNRKAVAP